MLTSPASTEGTPLAEIEGAQIEGACLLKRARASLSRAQGSLDTAGKRERVPRHSAASYASAQECSETIAKIDAFLEQARPAGGEWRWVPVEPTEEMWLAVARALCASGDTCCLNTCGKCHSEDDARYAIAMFMANAPPSAPQPASAPSISGGMEDLRKALNNVDAARARLEAADIGSSEASYAWLAIKDAQARFTEAAEPFVRTLLAQGGQNVG